MNRVDCRRKSWDPILAKKIQLAKKHVLSKERNQRMIMVDCRRKSWYLILVKKTRLAKKTRVAEGKEISA